MSQIGETEVKTKFSERQNLQGELDRLETMLAELKVFYEQYFSGVIPREPETEHSEVKMAIRSLRRAPFRNSAINYRLRSIEHRYSTYNTYWRRVLREREEGRYHHDVFKAQSRTRMADQERHRQTAQGQAEVGMEQLFRTYKNAIEKQTGKRQQIDFQTFQRSILDKARAVREHHGSGKLSFRVVVRDGEVSVQAKAQASAKGSGKREE